MGVVAFVKTVWINRSAPKITAAQLNRIEQGIADAHDFAVPEAFRVVGDAGQPAFENSWAHYDTDRKLRFYRHAGRCFMEGIIRSGVVGSTIVTLPVGYRPLIASQSIAFPIVAAGVFGVVYVTPTGTVALGSGASNVWVDLSAIAFRCV